MKFSDLTMTLKIGIPVLILLGVLMAISSVKGWYDSVNAPPVNTWIQQPEPKIITRIKRVEVPGPPTIVTLEKKVVVEKLKLPDWIKDDINKQVIADADIQPYEGITNAAAILDTQTGVGSILQKRMPIPLFGLESKVRVGGRYGFSSHDNNLSGEGYASYSFLRIGKIHFAGYTEAGRDFKGMVDIYYEF
jgi:hypothetical protein